MIPGFFDLYRNAENVVTKWASPENPEGKTGGGGSLMEKEAVFLANLPGWMKNLFEVMKLPFSPAVKGGGFVFVSGVTCFLDLMTEAPVEDIEGQTRETLEVIKDTLEAAGSCLDKVVNLTVFLRNGEDFSKMNEVYRTFFPEDPPARSTIVTGLVLPQMLVDMECTAIV